MASKGSTPPLPPMPSTPDAERPRSSAPEPARDEPSLRLGFALLAFYLPLGLTLEALHALKVPVYLGSSMRREMWTLAHAHGNLLGILLLVYAALGRRGGALASRALRAGALVMPAGFLLGGVLNSEGDPSLGVLLVPVGALSLLAGLLAASRA